MEYIDFLNFEVVMHPFAQSALGGIMIGLASWLLLASLGRVAGISGIAAGALVPIKDDTAWRWIFLVCLVLGGAVTAYWINPPATLLRPTGLLLASGLLVGFGTVLGSDCTSGHGVCGMGRQPGLCDGRRIVRFTVGIFCDAPRWAKTLKPYLADAFYLPKRSDIDTRLVIGSVLFGVG